MNNKVLYSLLALIVLVAGAATGVVLVQQRQTAPKATVADGIATIQLNPSSEFNLNIGDTFSVDIPFTTSGIAISGATAMLEYQYDSSASQPPIAVTDVVPNTTLVNSHQWRFTTSDYQASNGNATISIIAVDTSIDGYTSSGQTNLATVNFIVRSAGTIALSFDLTETKIQAKATGDDVLAPPPNPAGTYSSTTSGGGTTPTATPTPTTTNTGGNTNPTATPTPTTNSTGGNTTQKPLAITNITEGASLTDTTPTFIGTAANGATISINISGPTIVTGSVTATSTGSWQWTSPSSLSGGSYTATVTSGSETDTVNFTISTTTGATTLPESGVFEYTLLIILIGITMIGGGIILNIR